MTQSSFRTPCMCRFRRPFTLIELLVVMAIISILAGILIPALEGALESARGIACLNNLKQINSATAFHLSDHGDKYPRSLHTSCVQPMAIAMKKNWHMALDDYLTGSFITYNKPEAWNSPGVGYPHLGNPDATPLPIWSCPSDDETLWHNSTAEGGRHTGAISYFGNAHLFWQWKFRGNTAPLEPVYIGDANQESKRKYTRSSELKRPSDTLMIGHWWRSQQGWVTKAETMASYASWSWTWRRKFQDGVAGDNPYYIHNEMSSYLAADGHGIMLSPYQIGDAAVSHSSYPLLVTTGELFFSPPPHAGLNHW